ncbi:hypothetical protein [Limnohabitans sp. Bal53]|uniref:hypothetical protein n=1 Tax=Limnohabitans sp. Bal53 TaxID=1977910 RepID=UPI0018EEB63E
MHGLIVHVKQTAALDRAAARSFAADGCLLNIKRGPILNKGVILHSCLAALFAHIAPLSMNAAVVFETKHGEVEGDSASYAVYSFGSKDFTVYGDFRLALAGLSWCRRFFS